MGITGKSIFFRYAFIRRNIRRKSGRKEKYMNCWCSQALFEQIFHTAGLTEDEIRSFQRRCARKLRLNKSKIGSVLGRWNPRDHSDTKQKVIEDIMKKIKNHEQGEYFYYSRWKYPRQEDIYQLVVEPEGSYLCHVNQQKYYEFEDMG